MSPTSTYQNKELSPKAWKSLYFMTNPVAAFPGFHLVSLRKLLNSVEWSWERDLACVWESSVRALNIWNKLLTGWVRERRRRGFNIPAVLLSSVASSGVQQSAEGPWWWFVSLLCAGCDEESGRQVVRQWKEPREEGTVWVLLDWTGLQEQGGPTTVLCEYGP